MSLPNQQSQLIKHIICRIKENDGEFVPSDRSSEATLGSSVGETETRKELKQNWSTFKALFVKELTSKSQAKSAFILVMENICNICLKDSFGFTVEEIEKLDDFFVTFEDICLPILFLVYERYKFYSYQFCDSGSNKSNEEVVAAMITLSSFCGISWMPLMYLQHIITESIGIDDSVKQGLFSFLDTAGGRKFFDNALVKRPSSSKLYRHHNNLNIKTKTCTDGIDSETLSNKNKIIVSIHKDDILKCDKLVENKSNLWDKGTMLATVIPSVMKICTHNTQNKLGVVSPVKSKKRIANCTCPICGKWFVKKYLKKHLKSHVSERKYSCSKCSLTFKFKYFLNAHLKVHSCDDAEANTIKENNCKITSGPSLKFSERSKYIESQSVSLELFTCGACDEKFTLFSMYKAHCKLHSHVFQCQICHAQFKGVAKLQRHSLTHTGEKPFKCQFCQTAFADRSHLNVHMRVHSGEKPFKCQWCASSFSESTKLKNHIRIHTGEKPFVCEICGVMFSVSSNLKSHKKIHEDIKLFKCEICKFSTTHSSNLKDHSKLHLLEKKFTCDKCGASFLETAKLRRHSMVHTGEQPYSCEVCGKRFADKSHLTVHLRIHSGDKPFKCTHRGCSSAFVESSKLKNHMRRHTGEKPYICEVCGASFAVPYSLKSHMRRHTGEKPYKCTLCDYASSQSSNLKTHMSVHNGSRPHACTKCGASFSELSKLNRHKLVHGEVGENSALSDSSKKNDLLIDGDNSFHNLVAENHHMEFFSVKDQLEYQRKPGESRMTHFELSDTNQSDQDLCNATSDFGQFEKEQSYSIQKSNSLHLYQLVSQPLPGNVNSQISANDHHHQYLSDHNLINHSSTAGLQQLVAGQHVKDIEVSVLYNSALYKSSYFHESSVHLELGHL